MGPKDPGHLAALGVFLIAEPFDALVAGLAAVVARNFLEVVVNREVGEADLLDLGRRGREIHQWEAAEPRLEPEVLCIFLLDDSLDSIDLARESVTFLGELVDVPEQLLLLLLLALQSGVSRFELLLESLELVLGLDDDRVQISSGFGALAAVNH